MRQVTKTVFQFSELSETAKKKAIEWYQGCIDSNDYDGVTDDAKTIAALFGLDIDKIYWSGFSSQGDGACFKGSYRYEKGALKAVKDYAPVDTALHGIVKGLQDVQSKQFYKLRATTSQSGHHNHSGCMTVDVHHDDDQYRDIGTAEDDVTKLLREFADWIYSNLDKENDYLYSDENCIDAIEVNEYEFNENGTRA